jgi:glycosyltransferase involved in cell wall biosynthesis
MRYEVLIPSRNRYDLCLRAVRSVLAQTIAPDRVLVVDDCSDDPRYPTLVQDIGDERVEAVRLQTSSTDATASGYAIGYVRNAGLNWLGGSGRWLALLDDDDEWQPHKMEAQAAAASLGAGVICGNAINRTLDGQIQGIHHKFSHGMPLGSEIRDVTDAVRFLNPVIASTAIVRPDVVLAIGRQVPTGFGEDWDWWRKAARVAPINFLEQPLAWYTRDNPKEYRL